MDASLFFSLPIAKALSPEARAVVQTMTTRQLGHLADAVEHFAQVSRIPIPELSDRLLRGYADILAGHGSARLHALIVDVLMDEPEPSDLLH
jgi:hypothetical protein